MGPLRFNPRGAGCRWPAAAALLALTVACTQTIVEGPGAGHVPPDGTSAGAGRLASELAPAERWRRALRLLGRGSEHGAEAALESLRGTEGYGPRAIALLEQIRTPVGEYFPSDYFQVRLGHGQSISDLAERYLGDALQFYALARYNGIRTPGQVSAGQLIRIPMTPAARDVRRAEAGDEDADDELQPAAADPGPATEGATPTRRQVGPRRQARVEHYYRKATLAFHRQDLDATIDYCQRVLELQPDHSNCRLYRLRARELKRRLEGIPEGEAAPE